MCPSLPISLKILQTRFKGGVLGTEVKNAKKYVFMAGIEPAILRVSSENVGA